MWVGVEYVQNAALWNYWLMMRVKRMSHKWVIFFFLFSNGAVLVRWRQFGQGKRTVQKEKKKFCCLERFLRIVWVRDPIRWQSECYHHFAWTFRMGSSLYVSCWLRHRKCWETLWPALRTSWPSPWPMGSHWFDLEPDQLATVITVALRYWCRAMQLWRFWS